MSRMRAWGTWSGRRAGASKSHPSSVNLERTRSQVIWDRKSRLTRYKDNRIAKKPYQKRKKNRFLTKKGLQSWLYLLWKMKKLPWEQSIFDNKTIIWDLDIFDDKKSWEQYGKFDFFCKLQKKQPWEYRVKEEKWRKIASVILTSFHKTIIKITCVWGRQISQNGGGWCIS